MIIKIVYTAVLLICIIVVPAFSAPPSGYVRFRSSVYLLQEVWVPTDWKQTSNGYDTMELEWEDSEYGSEQGEVIFLLQGGDMLKEQGIDFTSQTEEENLEILNAYLDQFLSDPSTEDVLRTDKTEINGNPCIITESIYSNEDGNKFYKERGIVQFWISGHFLYIALFGCPEKDVSKWLPIGEEILGSIQPYAPPTIGPFDPLISALDGTWIRQGWYGAGERLKVFTNWEEKIHLKMSELDHRTRTVTVLNASDGTLIIELVPEGTEEERRRANITFAADYYSLDWQWEGEKDSFHYIRTLEN